jgi:hypothetical protein
LRARRVLSVLAVLGLIVGLTIALLVGVSEGHEAIAIGWIIQVLVLVGAIFLLVSRMRRRT